MLHEGEVGGQLRWMEALLEQSGDFYAVADRDGRILFTTEAGALELGRTSEDLVGVSLFELLAPDDVERARARWAVGVAEPGSQSPVDYWLSGIDGIPRCLEVVATNLLEDPAVGGVLVTARDITARQRAFDANEDLSRVLTTVTAMNELMIRATDPALIAKELCQILVDHGGYRLAAVVAPDGDAPHLTPVAVAGVEAGYFEMVGDDPDRPLWQAIVTGTPQVVHDVAQEAPGTRWGPAAISRGYATVLALPVLLDRGVTGALGIAAEVPHAFDPQEIALLSRAAENLTFTLATLRTRHERDRSALRAEVALDAITRTLANALEWRDPYTAGHQRRVSLISGAMARALGLPADMIKGIEVAAGIHDIGKIAVPAEILAHPGRLSPAQFNLVMEHSQVGHDIIAETEFPWPVAEMILQHHERLDGSGYPKGLRGDEILHGALVIAVADVVEAMASHRPYRPGHRLALAIEHVTAERGTLYHPDVVDVCVSLFRDGQLDEVLHEG